MHDAFSYMFLLGEHAGELVPSGGKRACQRGKVLKRIQESAAHPFPGLSQPAWLQVHNNFSLVFLVLF